jgi:hypothetical protein
MVLGVKTTSPSIWVVASALLVLVGCGNDPESAVPYGECHYQAAGETCSDGASVCQASVIDQAWNLCSFACVHDDDCPPADGFPVAPICAVSRNGTQCVLPCAEDDGSCPDGAECASADQIGGETRWLCLP